MEKTLQNAPVSAAAQRTRGPARNRRTTFMGAVCAGALAAIASFSAGAGVDVAQLPLRVGLPVPGNLSLVPSVEFPTLISVANFGDYSAAKTYVGYFNSERCYQYIYDDSEPKRHFEPRELATVHACANGTGAANRWSGNFLNWAATQTIDPFRSALTGGYRVKDVIGDTWLEKAIADRDTGEATNANFPRRTITGSALVRSATPAQWGSFRSRIDGLNNRMWFTTDGNKTKLGTASGNKPDNATPNPGPSKAIPYNPAQVVLNTDPASCTGIPNCVLGALLGTHKDQLVYEVSIRLQVCAPGRLEANCKQYSASNYKPEGLLQQYSDKLTYDIFGYQNNGSNPERDGGIMRARQKFIGPLLHYPDQDSTPNTAREWDNNGILIRNPDVTDASNTNAGIVDSGVINYLNKFGQMNTGRVAKSYDNVSELYYAALRYFKRQGNVPDYTTLSANATTARQEADGFPVISNWDDPIKYQCQANAILGIGDTNTWRDKNLPGPTSSAGEVNAKSPQVVADTSVDVVKALRQIMLMEGKSPGTADSISKADSYNGAATHYNSAYIAALAYDAHVNDIRPQTDEATGKELLPGKQTISTYWVDVVENGDYKVGTNQYALAAKYGAFRVPEQYDAYAANPSPLDDGQWWSTGEYVNDNAQFKRPDTFYTASEASKMVQSLTQAFKQIVANISGTSSAFGASSSQLVEGATLFQSSYTAESWAGDVAAFPLDPDSGAIQAQTWSAATRLASVFGGTKYSNRVIKVADTGTLKDFTWSNLGGDAQSALGSEDVVNYLRGDRSNEGVTGGKLRQRASVLGDIVDSQPVYVPAPNPAAYRGATFSGASTYLTWATDNASRTPIVYVGANDGMLHAFNAKTGDEVFAYVPKAALTPNLAQYAQQDYQHKFSVDGELTVASAYVGGSWKSVLVGTMGHGGRGVFALDVTDPAAPALLWDKTETDIPALGNTLGKPIIAQVANGDWRVILGNGPNGDGDKAQLIEIALGSGTATTVDLGGSNNGLSGVAVWNSDSDAFFDTAYAGDLNGNMWKISGLSGSAIPLRLFTATAGGKVQPITVAPLPAVRPNSANETWLFFGTGRYLGAGDPGNHDVQSWYGIKDSGSTIAGRTALLQRQIIAEDANGRAITSGTAGDLDGKAGWYIDLVPPGGAQQGERMVTPNTFQGFALIGTTMIPDASNPCNPAGRGFRMAIDPFTGARLVSSTGNGSQGYNYFDVNGDGKIDDGDSVGDGNDVNSGVALNQGANGAVSVGSQLYTTMMDSTQRRDIPPPGAQSLLRVAWREIFGE